MVARRAVALCLLVGCVDSFLPPRSTRSLQTLALLSRLSPRRVAASDELVDKGTFMAAVDVLMSESAKASGAAPPRPLAEAEAAGEVAYAIGKTTATLPLSEAEGLGLVEATYLVLVSGVTPKLAESGLQVKDTITSVSVEGTDLFESTRAMDMGATAERLTVAIQTAEAKGVAEIGLELNRLVELKFDPSGEL